MPILEAKQSVEQNYIEFEKQANTRLTPEQAKVLKRIGECGLEVIKNEVLAFQPHL